MDDRLISERYFLMEPPSYRKYICTRGQVSEFLGRHLTLQRKYTISKVKVVKALWWENTKPQYLICELFISWTGFWNLGNSQNSVLLPTSFMTKAQATESPHRVALIKKKGLFGNFPKLWHKIRFFPSSDHTDKLIFWRVIESRKNGSWWSKTVPGVLLSSTQRRNKRKLY